MPCSCKELSQQAIIGSCHQNGYLERPKKNISNHVSPKKKSRVSQSKYVISGAVKWSHVGQSKSTIERDDISASSRLKQIADAMGKRARHPSTKVVSNERIPRNKALSASYTSSSLRTDVPRAQSQGCEHASLSGHPSCTDKLLVPKTYMKPVPHIGSSSTPRAHVENTSKAPDMLYSQSLRKRTSIATSEADISLKSSRTDTNGHKTQAQLPSPSMPKTAGCLSNQSLVSSRKMLHNLTAGVQISRKKPLFGRFTSDLYGISATFNLDPAQRDRFMVTSYIEYCYNFNIACCAVGPEHASRILRGPCA
ncbi:hypothetical protein FGB62_221g06 [Gracilaria domingensis]|nr:hypothetical protein FGB62_221g06 [Gracilaria domingensis]